MKCPHCAAELLHRERGRRRCAKCKREFALEPKGHPLRLHDLRFQQVVAKLSQNGTRRYTPRQLHYAFGRKVVREQKPKGVGAGIGCFALSCIVTGIPVGVLVSGMMASMNSARFDGLILLLGLMLIAGLALVITAVYMRQPFRPNLPMTPDQFQREVLGRWQQVYGTLPPGLIDPRQPLPPDPPPGQLRAVLACPDRDVFLCLRANGLPEHLSLGLLPTSGQRTPAEKAALAAIRANPRLPLLVLHDASPEGCTLLQSLPMTLGLPATQKMIDLGIRPHHAIKFQLMRLGAAPSSELLHILQKRVAAAGSAHSSHTLTEDEFDWLERGFYSPLAALGPARLIRVVTQAMEQATTARPAVSQRPRDPETQAQAVGFMTWPET